MHSTKHLFLVVIEGNRKKTTETSQLTEKQPNYHGDINSVLSFVPAECSSSLDDGSIVRSLLFGRKHWLQ